MSSIDFWSAHDEACQRGETTYEDPQTGFTVFTRIGLEGRDKCCGAGCRHCPFDHDNLPAKRRAQSIQQPAWLSELRPDPEAQVAFLFWSGGKDSFLTFRAMQREGRFTPVLLTTFNARTRIIAHQEFSIEEVVSQAEALRVPLIGVPLHPGADHVEQLVPAFDLLPDCTHLCFGDLHLEHIRQWREEAFAKHDRTAKMSLEFPLWQADYSSLFADLVASGAACEISAIAAALPNIAVGDPYDARCRDRLPDHVDAMGENGEFHTRIVLRKPLVPG